MSSLFVLSSYPWHSSYNGVHVQTQLRALREVSDLEITVLAQIPHVPMPLRRCKKYSDYVTFPDFHEDLGVKVFKIPRFTPLPGKWFWRYVNGLMLYAACCPLLAQELGKAKAPRPILHSHWLVPQGVAGSLLAREFRLPHVITLHHGALVEETQSSGPFKFLVQKTLNSADHVVAVSEPLARLARKLSDPSRVSHIPLGVPFDRLQSLTESEMRNVELIRQGILPGAFSVLFVGSNLVMKGFYELFDACRDLANMDYPVHLTAVGLTSHDLQVLERKVEDLGLSQHFRLLGGLPWQQLRLYYHATDVYVLPSLSEGFPIALVEAAACGIPVVATPVGGIPSFLRDRENGLLIEMKSPTSIKEALLHLMVNPDARRLYGKNAVHDVMESYDITKNAQRLMRIYQALWGDQE